MCLLLLTLLAVLLCPFPLILLEALPLLSQVLFHRLLILLLLVLRAEIWEQTLDLVGQSLVLMGLFAGLVAAVEHFGVSVRW
jgi:hypothetical protein